MIKPPLPNRRKNAAINASIPRTASEQCSPDTALRDLKDLIDKGMLQQEPGGGRSTKYELARWK